MIKIFNNVKPFYGENKSFQSNLNKKSFDVANPSKKILYMETK